MLGVKRVVCATNIMLHTAALAAIGNTDNSDDFITLSLRMHIDNLNKEID
jgi:hypothetical protein